MASLTPNPASARRTDRRARCAASRRPGWADTGTVRGIRDSPYMRPISSMTSTSAVESGRHDGMVTDRSSPTVSAVKPIGSMRSTIVDRSRDSPRTALTRAGRTATVTRSGRFPSATTEPGRSVAASCCTNSSASRSSARSAMSGSMPRLKRAEASECRLCRAEVSATDCGSHQAASTMTSVVVSEISVDAPPITPARAIGTSSPSTMTPSAGSRARSTPSSVSSCSPALTRRTRSCAPRTLSRSKAWVGWPSSSIT